jgi:ribokinase
MTVDAAPTNGHLVCLGDLMIDVVARLDAPLAFGSDSPSTITLFDGGSAANTAAWLGWLGTPTGDPTRPTGTCIVLVTPDGERTMLPSAGANDALQPADISTDLLMAGDHLHLSAYSLLREGSRDAALAALRLAGRTGARSR